MHVLETPYCIIHRDASGLFLRFERTPLAYPSLAAVDEESARIRAALKQVLGERRVLADLRQVRPRNEPEFEVAIARLRQEVFARATRVAALVRTAAGLLQLKRHLREDGVPGDAFLDEDEAVAYLIAPASRRMPRIGSGSPPYGLEARRREVR